ncbi:tyrosine-type recombinase/integrase [Paenibacillus sp. GCM10012307]|uniref:Tyrosine-type recombinase/integrase n=1 Tax=Paenibacillus roseus TaxID=2798579 RepID=A0A934MMI2_9BACL|nr:tyrosine-type recombinase/integrase [Paenibacillus roseus]MBJ6359966.1 tyrosine-type recombinase/integrase [Paenibacillus roseus]
MSTIPPVPGDDVSYLISGNSPAHAIQSPRLLPMMLEDDHVISVMKIISADEDREGNYNFSAVSNLGMIYLYIHHRDKRRKISTKKEYMRELLYLLQYTEDIGKTDIRELNRLDMEMFQTNLEGRTKKSTTLSKKVIIVQSFLKWCYEESYLSKNIARGLRPVHKQREEIPDHDIEEMDLRQAIDYYGEHPKIKSLLLILATSGLRLNEVITPSWGDLYYDARRGRYYLRTRTKRDKLRHAHIKDYALEALLEYRHRLGMSTDINGRDNSPFYPNRFGKRYSLSSLSTALSRSMEEAGLTTVHGNRITPHYLRHYFTQTAFAKGAPLDWISETLDHSSTKITKDNYLSRMMKKERDVSDYVDLM